MSDSGHQNRDSLGSASISSAHPAAEQFLLCRENQTRVSQHASRLHCNLLTHSHELTNSTQHIISKIIIPENRCYQCHSSLLLDRSHGC